MATYKTLPAFMGEVDMLKTLQMLPGVQSGSEGTSGFYVRGGSVDQNLLSLTKEACEYYRAISALQGQGGLFGRNPANLPTNLSNCAVGSFPPARFLAKRFRLNNKINLSHV